MRYFLIQPAHRRFVKILRDSYNNGTPVILNEEDLNKLTQLFQQGTMKAVERHEKLYRIFLRAKNRPLSEFTEEEKIRVINKEVIQFIENRFFVAEWKHLRMTIMSSFMVPFLQWLIKKWPSRK